MHCNKAMMILEQKNFKKLFSVGLSLQNEFKQASVGLNL